jgi:ABC-type nickel/cobalt efflux system permease component RcnA
MIGVQWAIGHSCGVGLIAVGSLLLREVLPMDLVSSYSERAVGILLIGIGLWGLKKAFGTRIHAHNHAHDGEHHTHIHVHGTGHEHAKLPVHSHSHAALGIGTLHGLAGGSHLLGVLPALALPSTATAVAYLACYAIGTLTGIGFFSSALGLFAGHFGGVGTRAYQYLMGTSAAAAVVIGGAWLIL